MANGPPTWADGDILSASDVNEWFVPKAACKDSDTARSSTTTPTDDPDLQVSVSASGEWLVVATLVYAGPAGANFKFGYAWPSGGWTNMANTFYNTSGVLVHEHASASEFNSVYTNGTGTKYTVLGVGFYVGGGTAGTLSLQWSQGTTNATACTLYTGSYLALYKMWAG